MISEVCPLTTGIVRYTICSRKYFNDRLVLKLNHFPLWKTCCSSNTDSIALHERLWFSYASTIKHAAFKFGRWLDLGFYQLLLETPAHPIDG